MSFIVISTLPNPSAFPVEQSAKVERAGVWADIQYQVFEAIQLSDEEQKLLDAIVDRGGPLTACTPEEQAALEHFAMELDATVLKFSGRPFAEATYITKRERRM